MAIWWFGAFALLTLIELMTVNLVSIWFAIGAIVAMISCFFTDSLLVQTIVFAIASVISLMITKPLVKKMRHRDVVPTNLDRVIGKTATVTKEIDKDNYGEVKVLGAIWTACCDEKVLVGQKVKVLAIDGVKLIVKLEEE